MNDYKQECLKRIEYTNKYSKYSEENLIYEIQEKDKEIVRLNNIINELEKYIEIQLCQGGERETRDLVDGYDVLDKIKELKENKQ